MDLAAKRTTAAKTTMATEETWQPVFSHKLDARTSLTALHNLMAETGFVLEEGSRQRRETIFRAKGATPYVSIRSGNGGQLEVEGHILTLSQLESASRAAKGLPPSKLAEWYAARRKML